MQQGFLVGEMFALWSYVCVNFSLPPVFVSVKNVSMGEITYNGLQGDKKLLVNRHLFTVLNSPP